ncbi:leucine-rich repeat protein kinase family protein [Actinidia rufa]|uniref:Leucine-rich repeat protein kinase family protein n=1 Tax=Actinidia rufa TaxID=165716 RepID=A0A7J0DZU3_9ERIC|nr:leucine-rich repeat protein kinase family protein [Actinidia rufa]
MGVAGSWPFFAFIHIVVFLVCLGSGFPYVACSFLGGNETDRLALLAFKAEITADPLGALNTWNESIHFCQWLGVTCGRRHQRVTAIYLDHQKLSGPISLHIGNLSFLRELSLHNNSLSHQIPPEVGRLQRLQVLFLGNNSFSGEIPPNISACTNLVNLEIFGNRFEGKIPVELGSLFKLEVLDVAKNELTGGIPSALGNLSSLIGLNVFDNRIGGSIPIALGRLTNLEYLQLAKDNKSVIFQNSGELVYELSYRSLHKATDSFSPANLIGVGSFGSVYKGVIGQGKKVVVAVKVLNLHFRGAAKSFIAECKALKSIKHRNLVKVLTACSSIDFHGNDFKALVYEFMVNGSLEEWLHQNGNKDDGHKELRNLSLLQRLNIAIDVASALDYLHHHCLKPIVHCDLKPSNVLLDDEMVGHVEYGMGNEVSTFGDVYSYGILILEIFTRKRPTDNAFNDSATLHNFAKMALPEQGASIADPTLFQQSEIGEASSGINKTTNQNSIEGQRIEECLISILKVGITCSEELFERSTGHE